ncbi:hypothetical protein AYX13_04209 [Cryptococcus neoformans]|nr:hypothetical protein AYX13_04209 [Cryptococcus neoformans var. grubii]
MIIPPDPEKDPNIFSPSSSTPSLVPAPSEHSYFGTASWDGESLPPYEGRRRSRISFAADQSSDTRHTREGDVFSDENATHLQEMRERNPRPGLGVVIPATVINPAYQQSPGSSLGSVTPTATGPNASLPSFHSTHPAHSYAESSIVPASNTAPVASTSKLWESPSSQPSGPTRRILCLSPAASRALYKWWKKWRTWVLVLLVVILVGVALMIGLLLGMHSSKHDTGVAIPPWEDNNSNDDGKKSAIWQQGGSPNLTYVESRDGPSFTDGNLTNCNQFTSYNHSSAFSSLFTPFTVTTISTTRFTFPLQANGSAPSNFFFNGRGLGSSGTITFLGSEGDEGLQQEAGEGVITVDVIVRYAGPQALDDMMRVCEMARNDGGVGVGIYSPRRTDGKVSNPLFINPAHVPTSHILIRVPPSVYAGAAPATYFPHLKYDFDQMSVRFGDLEGVADMGLLDISNDCGGLDAAYVSLKCGNVLSTGNDVKGRWNVSEELYMNISDGSISADVILYDPSDTPDNSTTLQDRDFAFYRRGISSSDKVITTRFFSSSGYLDIRYLHHPTTVSLSSVIATLRGPILLHLHPNYIGPFSAKTLWGELRIPTPSPVPNYDPMHENRCRSLALGIINVPTNSSFAQYGLNQSMLGCSTDTVTGVAYWATVDQKDGHQRVNTLTVEKAQASVAETGNEVVVMGAGGDVEVIIDGS